MNSEQTSGSRRVGLIGVGIMGTAISTRLLECRQPLTICGRNKEKVAAVASKGATVADTPKDVAAVSDVVILSLNTAAIVENVVFGQDGIVQTCKPGSLLIDMSSIDPESTKTMAKRLLDQGAMHWLDCPLSGGAPAALLGKLTVMVGGAVENYEEARAVMQYLTANYSYMGPSGAGQTTKMVNQILCGIAFQAIAEATALAERGGVSPEKIPQALAGGRADSRMLQEFMGKMAARDYRPAGRIDNMVKDLGAAQEFAATSGLSMPVTNLVAGIHRQFVAAGFGDGDNTVLMEQFDNPSLAVEGK